MGQPPGERRTRVLLVAVVVAYAGGLAGLAAAGLYSPVFKTLVVPALLLVALLSNRLVAFLEDWAVFLGGLVLFDALRAWVYATVNALELPLYLGYVVRLEEALFGGATLPTRLQAAWLGARPVGVRERLLVLVHASHFVVFLLFGLALWLCRRPAFARFAAALLLVMYLGLVGYLVVPTVPPWMAADLHVIPPIRRVLDDVYNVTLPSLRRAFDTNPIAAMPSLHAAFPALCALVAFHHFGRWGWLLAAYLTLVSLAVVYLGEHYFLDVVAGALLSAAVYWLVYRTELAARLARVRLGGERESRAAGRPLARRAAVALLLLLTAEAVGQTALRVTRPFALSEAFVRRELVGRSDLASLELGVAAFRAQRYAEARDALTRAIGEVQEPRLIARAHELLALADFKLGAAADGERVLVELVARQPNDPAGVYWLTRRRYVGGRLSPEEVRAVIGRLAAHPDHERAEPYARALAALLAGQGDAALPR